MYIKSYKKGDPVDFIEKSLDTTKVHTTHLDIGHSSVTATIPIFPNNIPIDFLCKSKDEEKEYFIVYSPFIPKGQPMKITFVVDDEYFIPLSSLQPANNENGKHYHSEKLFFPLSYNNLIAFCNAKSLKYQIHESNGSKTEDGEDLIPLCRLLYETVFDKGISPETADYLLKKEKELSMIINKLNNNN